MNTLEVKQFLREDCEIHFKLPSSYNTWGEYIEGYILDTVMDDLDRYLPTWDRLTPEAFEERVINLAVPDQTGRLVTLRNQWLNLLTPW